MNDSAGKTTSNSLVISEKRPQKSGGCVGIFFQLFDWNRRLAKKKLFSKKLLPPARAKRASKKFGGDEKLPMAKLLLIADENRGGFPNAKKPDTDCVNAERTHELRTPGLVARLMGLESMPAVRRDKPKKHSHDQEKKKSEDNFSSCRNNSKQFGCCDQGDLNLGKEGHTKIVESRPQKLQKTGLFERQAVTRFGAEALQVKSILSSRSKKHHHQKLTSPVKSPRILSGRNASRLMEAATRILEPGLQATNRAKCALTYSASLHHTPKDEVVMEGTTTVLSQDQSNHYAGASKSLKGQSSCKSCGNLLDVMNFRPNIEDQAAELTSSALDFGYADASPQGSGRNKPKQSISSYEQERDVVKNQDRHKPKQPISSYEQERDVVKNQDQHVSLAAQAKANIRARSETIRDGKSPFREDQNQHCVTSQQCNTRMPSSSTHKQRPHRQSQMFAKDKMPPRPKSGNLQNRRYLLAANGAKDFVATNKNLSSCTRPRMPSKALESYKTDIERNAYGKHEYALSQVRSAVRKRRPMNGSGQVENSSSVSSTFAKQRTVTSDLVNGKGMGLNAHAVNRNQAKGVFSSQGEGKTAGCNKEIDVVSFTFSSPMRNSTGSSSSEMEENSRGHGEPIRSGRPQQKKLMFDENDGNSLQKPMSLRGDALGALLEQKLKELAYQEMDESVTGSTMPGRSTASILQELISALTAARPISPEDGDSCSVRFNQKDSLHDDCLEHCDCLSTRGQMSNANKRFQAEVKAAGNSGGLLLSSHDDHPSPGSVLEASFSNDSCFSGSLDGSAGPKLQPESMDCSYDQPQSSDPDADLSDSATSSSIRRPGNAILCDSVNNISTKLYDINFADNGLTGSKLNHTREVVLNIELLFGNTALTDGNGMEDFLIGRLLLEKLEALLDTLSISSDCGLGFMEDKEGYQLRSFLFDSMIECLDSKYGHYPNSGFNAWMKLPSQVSRDFLSRKVYEEIRRWTAMAGKIPDEIIEGEMSHSMGKWTNFAIEAFEMGRVIECDILQILVNEIVVDLWQGKACSS